MAERKGAAQAGTGRKSGGLGWLLAGIVIGVLGTVFLPDLAAPYLPEALRPEQEQVAGIVEAKSTEGERLLLTVGSEAGATLVTFRQDIAEIDLLVSVGDSVRLAVDEYAPFIDDARISRVMKPRDWRVGPAPLDTATAPGADTVGLRTPEDAMGTDDTASIDTTGTDTTGAGATGAPADTGTEATDGAPPNPAS